MRQFSSIYVGIMFAMCTGLLIVYPLSKNLTIQMPDELAQKAKQNLKPSADRET